MNYITENKAKPDKPFVNKNSAMAIALSLIIGGGTVYALRHSLFVLNQQ